MGAVKQNVKYYSLKEQTIKIDLAWVFSLYQCLWHQLLFFFFFCTRRGSSIAWAEWHFHLKWLWCEVKLHHRQDKRSYQWPKEGTFPLKCYPHQLASSVWALYHSSMKIILPSEVGRTQQLICLLRKGKSLQMPWCMETAVSALTWRKEALCRKSASSWKAHLFLSTLLAFCKSYKCRIIGNPDVVMMWLVKIVLFSRGFHQPSVFSLYCALVF